MFYTPILLHSLSKVIGNYHRIFIHEQPNMSTFNAEFIDPSQLSLPVHQLPYLQNEIFYQNSSYFTLRRLPVPWQQYYVPLCVVPSGLYSRYVNSDVNYDMVVPLVRTSRRNEEHYLFFTFFFCQKIEKEPLQNLPSTHTISRSSPSM